MEEYILITGIGMEEPPMQAHQPIYSPYQHAFTMRCIRDDCSSFGHSFVVARFTSWKTLMGFPVRWSDEDWKNGFTRERHRWLLFPLRIFTLRKTVTPRSRGAATSEDSGKGTVKTRGRARLRHGRPRARARNHRVRWFSFFFLREKASTALWAAKARWEVFRRSFFAMREGERERKSDLVLTERASHSIIFKSFKIDKVYKLSKIHIQIQLFP